MKPQNEEELMELTHGAIPGYQTAFVIVVIIAIAYMAGIFLIY